MCSGRRRLALATLGALAALAALVPAGEASAAKRCDYANVPYTVRQLPFAERSLAESWEPGGHRLAFAEDGQIKIFDVDRWEVTAVLTDPEDAASPTWTTDGRIFFEHRQNLGPNPPEVFVMNSDGSDRREVVLSDEFPRPPSGDIYYGSGGPHAKISPDGSTAVFTMVRSGHWTMVKGDIVPGEDGDLRIENPVDLNSDNYWTEVKGWTYDGRMMFGSSRGGENDRRSLNADVFTMDLASGGVARLTHDPAWEETGDLAAGDVLAFNSDRAVAAPYQANRVLPLPNDADFALVGLALVPLTAGTTHEIFIAGPAGDGGWVRRLTQDAEESAGSWASTQPKWSSDGTMIRFQQKHRSGTEDVDRSMLIVFECQGRTSRARR